MCAGAAAVADDGVYDLLVVGGGINGAGVARDAAGRGLSVLLCEKDDLASHTSSASTKLIHGGLRYLEHYEFSLVRKALLEREVLLRNAPHIICPLRFVMAHDPAMRPAWLIRMGMFLYDHLARREVLPGSESIGLREHPAGAPLRPEFTRGFAYSDGWVDDARLVVLNVVDAADHGTRVLSRTRCVEARRADGIWRATLESGTVTRFSVRARALVNAAGPWAGTFLRDVIPDSPARHLRLIKGSHIVVPRMFDHSFAYIFQCADKRIVFAIPYENDFTLLGTTDVEYRGDPGLARISDDEIAYLCKMTERYFAKSVTPKDVVWSYSGVRPLLDDESGDPSEISRDYKLEFDTAGAPLLSIWGGKITTFRRLSEEAVDTLVLALGERRARWTEGAALPGGDLSEVIGPPHRPDRDIELFIERMNERLPFLPRALVRRYARSYGSRMLRMLGGIERIEDMGLEVAPGLYEVELRYLIDAEWARSAEDILWRRTKLGLHLTLKQQKMVSRWMDGMFLVRQTQRAQPAA
ncbi:MAG: glycerol-3-phosphate dehydrogenase [Burkholderiaceae bacterium]|nr:glycerol-3-phosphate dehydrogenase [Burkholderiaceae bacterium]